MATCPTAADPPDTWLWQRWETGPTRPLLGRGELHVWGVDLRQVDDISQRTLDEPEHARAAAIRDARTRRLWTNSRAILRLLLGRYLQLSPAAVPIVSDERGKPSLASVRGTHLRRREPYFSLSHSGQIALYAFAGSTPIGVDVQLARNGRAPRDHVALARRAFGKREAERLRGLDPRWREAEFLRLWTRHEAELKRVGTGIGSGATGPGTTPWLLDLDIGRSGDPLFAAAVAWAQSPHKLQLWHL